MKIFLHSWTSYPELYAWFIYVWRWCTLVTVSLLMINRSCTLIKYSKMVNFKSHFQTCKNDFFSVFIFFPCEITHRWIIVATKSHLSLAQYVISYRCKRRSGYVLFSTGFHLELMIRTQVKVNHDSHRKARSQVRPWLLRKRRR